MRFGAGSNGALFFAALSPRSDRLNKTKRREVPLENLHLGEMWMWMCVCVHGATLGVTGFSNLQLSGSQSHPPAPPTQGPPNNSFAPFDLEGPSSAHSPCLSVKFQDLALQGPTLQVLHAKGFVGQSPLGGFFVSFGLF